MKRIVRQLHVVLASLLVLSLLQPAAARAAMPELPETGYGKVLDVRKTELAPGAIYTWYDLEDHRGNQKVHMVEFDPNSPHLELRAGTKDGYVYGMKGVTEMAAHLDGPGNRVIAGVNGDFYDISGTATGVPNGMFMDGGKILTSPSSSFAFGLRADGTSIYGSPQLDRSITIGGATTNLTHINRHRGANALVLYTSDYYTSTRSGADGTEVVLDIVSGEVKSGETMQLQVLEIRSGQGDTPLAAGQVVLSASGSAVPAIAGLQPGDEVSASFQLQGEWADVLLAIGGNGPLVKDGVPQDTGFNAGVHPRTAIGTKADGSIVLFEVDGRQPGTSEGVQTNELERMLLDVGVVDAMNLDGGGSSTFVARMPGTGGVRMMNTGSDGGERRTGNGLLLINTAPELGEAARLAVSPGAERILQGSTLTFSAAGIDANGHPVTVAASPQWQVTPELGTIDEQGVFTAGDQPGFAAVLAAAAAVQGEAAIEVVTVLDSLHFPEANRSLAPGAELTLQVTALRDGQRIHASNRSFTWEVTGDIGTIDENGRFTAADDSGLEGQIIARYGEIEAVMQVVIGQPPVILEGFEDGIGAYRATGAQFRSVNIEEVTDPDYVRSGEKSVKLQYDFTGTSGTSGVYLQSTAPGNLEIPGYPQKISMWVYGDGNNHWLRGQITDGNNGTINLDFTDSVPGVDWTGWRYVEADVQQGRPLPLRMVQAVRYMETSNLKKDAGAIYIDDIRAVYGPIEEDRTPPVIRALSPAPDAIVTEATPEIRVIAEDAGYDPGQHPGTTLIDPDSIRVYLNDERVEHSLYPPEGRIAYRPVTPLPEGRHKVKVAARDLSGNQTIREWYFTVNMGSPYYAYETPETVFTGRTYTLDISAAQAAELTGGDLSFTFDPAKAGNLEVVRGAKLTEEQLASAVNDTTGQVSLEFSRLDGTLLAEEDWIAQIRYTIKPDVLGPYIMDQVEGGVSGEHVIAFASGTIETADGASQPFIGHSPRSRVEAELKLTWDHYATALGEPAVFTVAEMAGGAKVEGADLLVDGERLGSGQSGADGKLTSAEATGEAGAYRVQAVRGDAYSPIMTFTVAPSAGTREPYNISVTMGNDAQSSRQFAWHTHPEVTDTVVELVEQAAFTDFEAGDVIRIQGESSTYTTFKDGTMRVHKATAAGLEPGTAYVYRVGDGAGYVSAQGTFRTSDPDAASTQFLFLTDSQGGDASQFETWGRTLDKALTYMPEPEFLLHGGDLIDKSFEQREWNWWFEYAQEELLNTTLVPVIGNHEVNGSNGYGDYLAHLNNPDNGPVGSQGISFSFDVQDTHIVVLNTEGSVASFQEQAEWLDQDLAASDKKWTVVALHQGPYGSTYANTNVQSLWVPLFDKYEVDLVLSGHDHIYLRTYAMQGNEISPDGRGTRYVIGGSSGTKFYPLTPRPYQEVVFAEREQVYTAVQIEGDELTLTARAVHGNAEQEVDRFTLTKEDREEPVPVTVTVDPPTAGMALQETLQLQATVTPETAPSQEVTWSVVDAQPEGAVTVDEHGLVTAVMPGTATVRATSVLSEDAYADSVITVADAVVGIELQGLLELKPGESDQVSVEAVYASGERTPLSEGLVFSSSDPEIAAIDEQGLVTAMQVGEAEISVSYGDLEDAYRLTVTEADPVLTAIELEGPAELAVGEVGSTVTNAVYSNGVREPLTERLTFASSDPEVAAVSEAGEITALSEGTATIQVTYLELTAELEVRVYAETIEPELDRLELSGLPATLTAGQRRTLTVEAIYTDETRRDVTEEAVFASSETRVADVSEAGVVTARQAGRTEITASYEGLTATAMLQVQNAWAPDPPTTPEPPVTEEPEEPAVPEQQEQPEPEQPEPAKPGQLEPTMEQLQSASGGRPVVLAYEGKLSTLVLPGHAAELLGGSALTVTADNLTLTIPRSVLAELMRELPAGDRQRGKITLQVAPLTPGQTVQFVAEASAQSGAAVRAASEVLTFLLHAEDAAGAVRMLDKHPTAISITLPVDPDIDPALTGLYGVTEAGALVYIGGKVEGGQLTAELAQFNRYAVLEYDKTFADLPAQHWAAMTVKRLSARQLVNGVAEDRFQPTGQVTRAEFAAMLARVLGLESGGSTSFADVPADQWYAQEVAAAHSAGIVNGVDGDSFAPKARVTRQEMATMLIRAYVYATGNTPSAESGESGFTDLAGAPVWAQAAIGAARGLGLIQGREPGRFEPAGHGTRAESAQLILNLVQLLESGE
ncbi:Ig-like domain-containing protein [Paenibacillus sp. 1P07SE]|uniref:Ig-like domain-containing protein n=1 Tax=Paenibacillus sp. 1P07SE TaxID=3132209 RepID=UPI0039A47AC1